MNQEQTCTRRPRLIIMRHSERLDFVLRDPNWPTEAFIDGVYSPTLVELPSILPTRANPAEYILDTPLTRHGKAHAHHTGEFFRSLGLIPSHVYSSPAMRCVQTADSVLDGLGIRETRPLRIDLALHEPTRQELPLQSAEYFSSVNFHVDLTYQPILSPEKSRSLVGETRLEYCHRMYRILMRILSNLRRQTVDESSNPPTVLIVTHKSCVTLLGALLNVDNVDDKLSYLNEVESSKRREVSFLSMIIAEYDARNDCWTFLQDFPRQMPLASSQ